MGLFAKLTFLFKKPSIIIVTGTFRQTAAEAIFKVLKSSFRVKKIKKKPDIFDSLGKNVLIWSAKEKELDTVFPFIKDSKKPVLVITNINDTVQETSQIKKLVAKIPSNGSLILNFDGKVAKEIMGEVEVSTLTFGLQEGADFLATDIKEIYGELAKSNRGTNFKINYEGNIVPFWLKNILGKEHIYAALSATALGLVFGLNLVDVSQSLKN